jgi:hypothetical protein
VITTTTEAAQNSAVFKSKLDTITLPTELLHAASLYTSDDSSKGAIQSIGLRWHQAEKCLAILATNGHIAFRVKLPLQHITSLLDQDTGDQTRSVILKPKQFSGKKPYPKVRLDHQQAQFLDRDDVVKCIEVFENTDHQYPQMDQLFPETYTCTPANSIGFNANYLSIIGKAVTMCTANSVCKFYSNTPTQPALFQAEWGIDPEVLIDMLIMPVQIRA